MLENRYYSFSELQQLMESNEFKAKLGDGVTSTNKNNNNKAVKDINKSTDEYNKSIKPNDKKSEQEISDFPDYNKTTMDVRFNENGVNPKYIKRVKELVKNGALVKDDDESSDTKGNENFYKYRKTNSDKISKQSVDTKNTGLATRIKNVEKKSTPFSENKKIKRLTFKNTIFITESQVLDKVPEDYKINNNKFIMKDANGTEYMIECYISDKYKYPQLKILGKINKKSINEELLRMNELINYSSSEYNAKVNKANENDVESMLVQMRKNITK